MRRGLVGCAAVLMLFGAGCQTAGPRVLSIPTTRDYQDLPPASVEAASAAVAQARRAGAAHSSPYEYYSAEEYLRTAQRMKGDAARDYAALAQSMAEEALRGGPAMEPAETPADLSTPEGVRAEFERLVALREGLDGDKAGAVAPVLYARATTGLSRAEYLLGTRRGWRDAAEILPGVAADLNTIAWQDSDGDGVADLKDAAPMVAEDKDGFEDEDGAPELDNDRDGVPDSVDREPTVAETPNRWHDADGAADRYPALEPIYFAEGSTALPSDAKGYLQGLKHILDEWPGLKLHIKGYSDNLHSDVYSMDLSQRRAQDVQRFLMLLGVSGGRLISTYHGQAEVAAGNAPADPALGNRVELVFE